MPLHCWTGEASSFALMLRIERSAPRVVVLECLASASEHNWDNVFLECDQTVQLCRYRRSGSRHLLLASLPARPGVGSVLLRYHLQETRPLAPDSDWSDLSGRVGLCITQIRVTSQSMAQDAPLSSRRPADSPAQRRLQ